MVTCRVGCSSSADMREGIGQQLGTQLRQSEVSLCDTAVLQEVAAPHDLAHECVMPSYKKPCLKKGLKVLCPKGPCMSDIF